MFDNLLQQAVINFLNQSHTWLVSVSNNTYEYHDIQNNKSDILMKIIAILFHSFYSWFFHFWFVVIMMPHHRSCDVSNPLLGHTKITQHVLKQNKKE